MKKEHWISIGCLLILWYVCAALIQNTILIPYPHEVLFYFGNMIFKSDSYLAIGMTLFRVLKGFVISFLLALGVVLLIDRFPRFGLYFQPINILAKTIPNVSYMILALIWLGSEGAISLVVFMILFPIFFNGLNGRLKEEMEHYQDIETLYPETFLSKLKYCTFPLIKEEMINTSKTALSLALKVGVMAEILGSAQIGIGRQLYLAKINLDTARLIAWTLVIILLSVLFDLVFHSIALRNKKEG
ncbi:MAG: hypothetical protein J6D29_07980 [Solobacterium sp.]|nr:hypothetical protein [Solobacterium sp.]